MSARFAPRHLAPVALIALPMLLVLSGCAGSPYRLAQMSPTEIQSASDENVCNAYATFMSGGRSEPVIVAEVGRRRLNCAAWIERAVSDCSQLQVLSAQAHPAYSNATIVTVRNRSDRLKAFRVTMGNISSSRFRIAPRSTESFGIAVDPNVAMVATVVGGRQGPRSATASLYECVTTDF